MQKKIMQRTRSISLTKIKIRTALLLLFTAAVLIRPAQASAALVIDPDAISAVNYENEMVPVLRKCVDLYRLGMIMLSPLNDSGKSEIKGRSTGYYDDVFAGLEHNQREMQAEQKEMWQEILESTERKAADLFVRSIKPASSVYFGENFPILNIGNEKYDLRPSKLYFFVPSWNGVVLGEASKIDRQMREYLITNRMFFPVLEIRIPVREKMVNNRYFSQVCRNISRSVPEVGVANGFFIIKIFPIVGDINQIIYKSREELRKKYSSEK